MKRLFLIAGAVLISITSISQNKVTTVGRDIQLNNSKYRINGICYHPIKKGQTRVNGIDLSQVDADIVLMKAAGINTVRLYVPVDNQSFYDKLDEAGIKAIVGIPSFDDTYKYSDITNGTYLNFIKKYMLHPAILFWELGNEYNYHPEWFNNNIDNWYTMLNNAADEIHKTDAYHPVSTAHGEVPTSSVIAKCPNVDIWGMNIYRWDDPSSAISTFKGRSQLPFYLSEAGTDSYDTKDSVENETDQANAVAKILTAIANNYDACSGVTIFSFTDGWWKDPAGSNSSHDLGGFNIGVPYDSYANEEWYGITDIDRNPKKAYDTLSYLYNNVIIADIQNYTSNPLKILPNPSNNGIININTGIAGKVQNIELFDLNGRAVYRKTYENISADNNIELNTYLQKGLYIVVVVINNEKYRNKILIK